MNRFKVNGGALVWALLLGLVMATIGSADAVDGEDGKDMRFAGESLPEPPFQHRPWTPPKLPNSPEFSALIETTQLLFDNGMSDPRGCDYRRIKIEVGDLRSESAIVETSGWVLPQAEATKKEPGNGSPDGESTRKRSAQRFAVCWNGLVYPVISVGDRRDIDKDIEQMFAKLKKSLGRQEQAWMTHLTLDSPVEAAAVAWDGGLPIQCPLLLRLGKGNYAMQLWEIIVNPRKFEAPVLPVVSHARRPKLVIPTPAPIPGLEPLPGFEAKAPATPVPILPAPVSPKIIASVCETIIDTWLRNASARVIGAYMRKEDRLASLGVRNLAAAMPHLGTRLESLTSEVWAPNKVPDQAAPLKFLDYLPALAKELDRREKEGRRTSVRIREPDKAKRIQELIRRLEDIGVNSTGMRATTGDWGFITGASPFVQVLIAEGNDAVIPLLECLETDRRLTRTVMSNGLQFREFVGVDTAAYLAIAGILQIPSYDWLSPNDEKGRAEVVAKIRSFWDANKDISLADRWFAVLADDAASPSDWDQAASNIIRASKPAPAKSSYAEHFSGQTPVADDEVAGVAILRARTDPSVSDLLKARIKKLSNDGGNSVGAGLIAAAHCANYLKEWDGKAQVQTLHGLCKDLFKLVKDAPPGDALESAPLVLGRLATDVIDLGDSTMIDDYAQWLREVLPGTIHRARENWVHEDRLVRWFEPMWRNADSERMQDVAFHLFADEHSEWSNYIKIWLARGDVRNLIGSPLLGLKGFREMVISELSDHSPIGFLEYSQNQKVWEVAFEGNTYGFMPIHVSLNPNDPLAAHPPNRAPVRGCDICARELCMLQPMPTFQLYWPEDKRDAAIAQCRQMLQQYGARYQFSTRHPMAFRVDFDKKALMSFPEMNHPATDGDVKAGTAIFSLPQVSNPERWPMHQFPIAARLKTGKGSDREGEIDGLVWQAEEETTGARRQLYFGFCGKHRLMRVAAEQLEFPGGYPWNKAANGLESKIVFKSDATYLISKVESPLVLTLSFRNLDATHSLDLKALYPSTAKVRLFSEKKAEHAPTRINDVLGPELRPTRSTEFELPALRETLQPRTDTQIMEMRLHDFFPITQPGGYYLEVIFGSSRRQKKSEPIWARVDLE